MKEGFPDLTRMIRSIQRGEGNPACFDTAKGYCDRKNCVWREYCLKKIEGPPAAADYHPEKDAEREHLPKHEINKVQTTL